MDFLEVPRQRFDVVRPGMFVFGLIVGFGMYWLLIDQGLINKVFVREDTRSVVIVEETEGIEIEADIASEVKEVPTVAFGENVLVASNQPAGDRVIMSMVSLETNAWIAIHEDRGDGKPGNILGATRFDAGRYFAQKIELLRRTEEGSTYFAILHADDGDSEFDYKQEIPLRDSLGNFILAQFIATAPVEKE